MKRKILVMCTFLFVMTAQAQFNERDRLISINPLRNGDGSFVKANNPLFFNSTSTDTTTAKRTSVYISSSGDPFAFRINSIQALCDLNSLKLNWTTVQQQSDADHFEIEQSVDGGITWTHIGIVPATRFKNGTVPYNFVYNKSLGNVDLRVAAVSIAGKKRYSSIVRSACGDNNLFSVDNFTYGTVNIRIGSPITQNVKIIVTSQSGVVVLMKEAGLTKGVNSISLDMSSLQRGIYVLNIFGAGGAQRSTKIVKQ